MNSSSSSVKLTLKYGTITDQRTYSGEDSATLEIVGSGSIGGSTTVMTNYLDLESHANSGNNASVISMSGGVTYTSNSSSSISSDSGGVSGVKITTSDEDAKTSTFTLYNSSTISTIADAIVAEGGKSCNIRLKDDTSVSSSDGDAIIAETAVVEIDDVNVSAGATGVSISAGTIEITDGIISGGVSAVDASEGVIGEIFGGRFSHPVDSSLFLEDYACSESPDAEGFYSTSYVGTNASASVDGVGYETLGNAQEAVNNSLSDKPVLKLLKDANNWNPSFTHDLVLDLNGNDITTSLGIVFNGIKVEITGSGTISNSAALSSIPLGIEGSKNVDSSEYTVVTIGKDVVIRSTQDKPAIQISPSADNPHYGVILNIDGTVEATNYFAMTIQGKVTATDGNAPTININGTVTGADTACGIYAAGYGVWNIHGKISGGTGIELRAGTLNVYDGAEITATSKVFKEQSNGDGTTITGAGIAVSQHTTNLPIDVNIEGGSVSGLCALYEKDLQDDTGTDSIEIEISDGKFQSTDSSGTYKAVQSENVTGFIHGGTINGGVEESALDPVCKIDPVTGDVTVDETKVVAVIGEDSFSSLEDALAAVKDGQIITLYKTVVVDDGLTVGDITIVRGDRLTSSMFQVEGGGVLTMNGTTLDGNGSFSNGTTFPYIINIVSGSGTGDSRAVLDGVTIKNNRFTAVNVSGGTGGTLPTFEIKNSDVTGILIEDGEEGVSPLSITSGDVVISNSTFSGNSAKGSGGAVYIFNGSLNVIGTTFTNNTSGLSGGAIYDYGASLTIEGCTFSNNSATGYVEDREYGGHGGAIYIDAVVSGMTLSIKDTGISGNKAGSNATLDGDTFVYGNSGGIYVYSIIAMTLDLDGVTVKENSAMGGESTEDIYLRTYDSGTAKVSLSGECDLGSVILDDYDSSAESQPFIAVNDGFSTKEGTVVELECTWPAVGTQIVSGDAADPSMFELSNAGDMVLKKTAGGLELSESVEVAFQTYKGTSVVRVASGEVIPESAYPTSDRAGFSISGWMNGSTSWNKATAVTEDIVLTAVWAFEDGTLSIMAGAAGETLQLTAVDPGYEGITPAYSWTGPSTGSANVLTVTVGGTYALTATYTEGSISKTLTATVTIRTVTFDDSVTQTRILVADGGSISESDYPEISERVGFTAIDWDGTDTSNVTSDLTVEAVWMQLIEVNVTFSGELVEGGSIIATVTTDYVPEGEVILLYTMSEMEEPVSDNMFTITSEGDYTFIVCAILGTIDNPQIVAIGMSETYSIRYSENQGGEIIPMPFPDDDDEYVPPVVPVQPSDSGEGDTTTIVACAAAAVVAALMAVFLIIERRRN